MNINLLLKRPPVALPEIAGRLSTAEANDIIERLDFMVERAAGYAAYLGEACGVYGCGRQEHVDALEAFNKTRKKIRKALGFSITYPINF